MMTRDPHIYIDANADTDNDAERALFDVIALTLWSIMRMIRMPVLIMIVKKYEHQLTGHVNNAEFYWKIEEVEVLGKYAMLSLVLASLLGSYLIILILMIIHHLLWMNQSTSEQFCIVGKGKRGAGKGERDSRGTQNVGNTSRSRAARFLDIESALIIALS